MRTWISWLPTKNAMKLRRPRQCIPVCDAVMLPRPASTDMAQHQTSHAAAKLQHAAVQHDQTDAARPQWDEAHVSRLSTFDSPCNT
eukprot:5114183-Amphidinium_carterae.1